MERSTHLAQQAAKRHDAYLTAEITSLRLDLRAMEDRVAGLLRRLETAERMVERAVNGSGSVRL